MAKLKISQMPSNPVYADSVFPMVHDGINYKISFYELKQSILAGFNPGTGVGVEYVRTDFTDETNLAHVEFSLPYRTLLEYHDTPLIQAGQVAQISNTDPTRKHYEIQQNLIIDNSVDAHAFQGLNSDFKRLEVEYDIQTILFITNHGEFIVLQNQYIDSFQRTSEAIELRHKHNIDHQINFILEENETARITNQILIKRIRYDFQDVQVSQVIGIIRVVEVSHDSYLNTKIFS